MSAMNLHPSAGGPSIRCGCGAVLFPIRRVLVCFLCDHVNEWPAVRANQEKP